MKQIKTKDGSATYHNEKYDETYHSVSGAKQEAEKKFVDPCKINEIAKNQKEIKILDICFGLGYNSAAAIDAVLGTNPDCRIKIIALENDQEILDEIKRLETTFNCYELIKEIAEKHRAERGNIEIELLLGDARKKIKEVNESFDAVFLDPFSPKKQPELWTEEFFKDICKVMKKGAILTTYSCAKSVRENLSKAGFKVKDGPVIGRKAAGTIAVK